MLWVNTIGTRSVGPNSYTIRRGWEKLRNWSRGLQQVAESMWVVDLPMLPTAGSPMGRRINRQIGMSYLRRMLRRIDIEQPVVLTTLPHSLDLFDGLSRRGLIYYCTDDYSHWPSAQREELLQAEQRLVGAADLVLGVSRELVGRLGRHRPCDYFPHAVNFEHFASTARITSVDPELASIPGPRIGFFGLIYEKLDFALLAEVARRLPQAQLVMIGPVDFCPQEFSALPNVHLLGSKPYQDLPCWLAGFDVLLLPYQAQDEMIRQSNPLKLRECLATGKPTVSVELPEVRLFEPHVRVGRTSEEFVRFVENALQSAEPAYCVEKRQAAAREGGDWVARAEQLRNLIDARIPCNRLEGATLA